MKIGKAENQGKPGESINVEVGGKIRTVKAGNDINSGKVLVVGDHVFSESSPTKKRSQRRIARKRSQKKSALISYPIKILAYIENTETGKGEIWLYGNVKKPKKVYEFDLKINESNQPEVYLVDAIVDNQGKKEDQYEAYIKVGDRTIEFTPPRALVDAVGDDITLLDSFNDPVIITRVTNGRAQVYDGDYTRAMNYKGYGQASIDSEFLLDDADIRVRLDLGTQGNYEQTVMNAWGTSEATPGNNFRVDLDSGVGTSLNALPEVPRPVVDFPINYTFPTLADDILSPINSISVSGNFKESIISEDVSSLTFIDFTGEPSGRFINYELPENTLIPDNYSNFFTTARHLTFFYTADVWYYSLEAPYYRVSKRFGFDSSTVDGSRDDILNTNNYVFSSHYPSDDKPERLGFTTLNLPNIGTEEEELNISYVDIFHTEYALQNNIANRDKGGTEHRSSAYHRTGSGNYIFRGHPLPFSMEAVGGEIDNLYVDQPRRYTRIKSPTILNNGKTSFIYYNYIFFDFQKVRAERTWLLGRCIVKSRD